MVYFNIFSISYYFSNEWKYKWQTTSKVFQSKWSWHNQSTELESAWTNGTKGRKFSVREVFAFAENLPGTCENRGHKSDVTAWHNIFDEYVVNNNNNNGNKNKIDIHTPSNVTKKYARENTVIYLFMVY